MDKTTLPELIKAIKETGWWQHPGLRAHAKRAMATGEPGVLLEYLKRNPAVCGRLMRDIRLLEAQKAVNPFAPAPTRPEEMEMLQGPVTLGYVNCQNGRFGVQWDTFCRPSIILGRPGSGKSQLAKYILTQAVLRPRGFNVIIPDLKREYRHLAALGTELKVLDRLSLRLNPLEVPAGATPQDHVRLFARTFVSENYLVGTSENELIELVTDLYRRRGVLAGSQNFPTLAELYQMVSHKLAGPAGKMGYHYKDVLKWLQNRLFPYTTLEAFSYPQGLDLVTLQENSLVLEMDTGFTDREYNFLTAFLTNILYTHNKANDLSGAKLRHLVVVDEARILFQANRDKNTFGESIVNELVSKTRDYGIGFLVLSQEAASISQVLRSLAYLKIAFPLTDGEDIAAIEKSFGLDPEQRKHLFKLPPQRWAVVSYGGFSRPFLLAAPWFQIKRRMDDHLLKQRMAAFWESIRQRSESCQSDVVEQDPSIPPELTPMAAALLFFLGKEPFLKVTQLKDAPGFKSPVEVARALEELEQKNLIIRRGIRTGPTKPSVYPELLPKAWEHLGMNSPPGKGGFEHKLFQHLVAASLKAQGLKAVIEGRTKSEGKAMDVLASHKDGTSTAYEITLNLGNLLHNIRQDLAQGAARVVVVTPGKTEQQQAKDELAQAHDSERLEGFVEFSVIADFKP